LGQDLLGHLQDAVSLLLVAEPLELPVDQLAHLLLGHLVRDLQFMLAPHGVVVEGAAAAHGHQHHLLVLLCSAKAGRTFEQRKVIDA
tara:strand:+ start:130 stop:390 length:261 start_codon:yes stop_codon:yes gene_type:complete